MRTKYPHALAEELYQESADEERGSSSEGIGWAGLYDFTSDEYERNKYGAPFVVLVESTDGFVDYYRCQSYAQAEAILEQYDTDSDES